MSYSNTRAQLEEDILLSQQNLLKVERNVIYALLFLVFLNLTLSFFQDKYFFIFLSIISLAQVVYIYQLSKKNKKAYYKARARTALGVDD